MAKRRDNSLRTDNDQFSWCRKNYINLKGMREWMKLKTEIHARLKRFRIEEQIGPAKVTHSAIEKPIFLRVIFCFPPPPVWIVLNNEKFAK